MRFIEQSILQKRLDITRAKADAAALKKKQDLVSIRADDAKLPDVQKSLRQPFADIGANIASLQSWTQAPAGNAQTGQPVIQGDSPLASRVETLTTIVQKLQATALISNAAVTTANVSASLTSGSQKSGPRAERQKEEETSRKDDRISKDAEYRGRNRNDDSSVPSATTSLKNAVDSLSARIKHKEFQTQKGSVKGRGTDAQHDKKSTQGTSNRNPSLPSQKKEKGGNRPDPDGE